MKKILVNSILSICLGVILSITACFLHVIPDLVNFFGGMCILGGGIFIDEIVMNHIYGEKHQGWLPQLRLVVYFVLGIILLLVPIKLVAVIEVSMLVIRITKGFGIGLLVLAMWKFYSYTTKEVEQIHKK